MTAPVDSYLLAAQAFLEMHPDEPESQDVYHAHVHGRSTREMIVNAAERLWERLDAQGE